MRLCLQMTNRHGGLSAYLERPLRRYSVLMAPPFGARGPRRAVILAAAVGGLVTLISLLPLESVAYHSPTLHVAIETAATFVALLCAFLLFGRFLRSPTRGELAMAASLLLLALTNLCYSVIPWIADEQPGSFDTWAPVAGRLLGAAGLAASAWMSPGLVVNPRRAAARTLAGVVGVLVVIGLLGGVLAPHLPVGIDPNLPPSPSGPDLVGEPALLVFQFLGVILYAVAAVGFTRRAERTGDELTSWFAAAATLAAFSRLNYFLFPSINSEWVYTGDFLRLGFYMLVLIGTLREIVAYQRELSALRVDRERRRIARDLHDGLAQELAFIVGQASRLPSQGDDPSAAISSAAARALAEARQAIATLSRPAGGTLDASVALAAEEVASRNGVELRLELAPDLDAPDQVHNALARIVREAVSNAIRHGKAHIVRVELAKRDGVRLAVEDDGQGIDGRGKASGGFGLVSMRERAEALGGTMAVGPGAERGTRVEIWLP